LGCTTLVPLFAPCAKTPLEKEANKSSAIKEVEIFIL
jgi:hypothetical protein